MKDNIPLYRGEFTSQLSFDFEQIPKQLRIDSVSKRKQAYEDKLRMPV